MNPDVAQARGGWRRAVFDDEVIWWPPGTTDDSVWDAGVAQFPFVPGYFVVEYLTNPNEAAATTPLIPASFPTLSAAKLACLMALAGSSLRPFI